MTTPRRTFLTGAAVGVALLHAPPARASDRLTQVAATLRARGDRVRDGWIRGVAEARDVPTTGPLAERLGVLGAATAGFSVVKDIEALPVEDQAHPAVQALLRESVAAVGRGARACGALFDDFLASPHPQREVHLHTAMRETRRGVDTQPVDDRRKAALRGVLDDVHADAHPGQLERRVQRALGRLRKAEALASELARGDSAVLQVSDPEVLRRVDAAAAAWGEPAQEPQRQPSAAVEVMLGILVLGVGVAGGGLLIVVGVCGITCSSPGAVFMLLCGVAILGLAIWGAVELFRMAHRATSPAPPDTTAVGPLHVVSTRVVGVLPGEGWMDSGVDRLGGDVVVVAASGAVRAPGAWPCGADGGGAAAGAGGHVPTAPRGALVGRIGSHRFFLGAEGVVPDGEPGRLLLAINEAVGAEPLRGQLVVEVTRQGADWRLLDPRAPVRR